MKRTFFLVCATVVTLSIAAAASTPAQARPCSKEDSKRDREECLIRSAIYTAVSQAEAAAASAQQQAAAARAQQRAQKAAAARAQQQAAAARAQQQAAAARETKPTEASSPPATCGLTKEYVDYAVKFRDTCTGEWAQHERH